MDSSEREREQRIAAEAEPEILDALARGTELQEVAETIARRYGIDEIKAYRWSAYIDESRQKKRRRLAGIALAVTWLGTIAAVVGVAALIFVATTLVWTVLTVIGALLAVPALIVALFARRIAYRR